ncbi:lysophospholipid acyltransferase [Cladochytrium tenue]|nr:lysophospholipid acyltransferase [Cladochytrium tenue]
MPLLDLAPLANLVGLPETLLAPALILVSAYLLTPIELLLIPRRARAARNIFSILASGLQFVAFFDCACVRVDHTVPMMVLVQKLTNFAWACYDGTRSDKELTPEQKATEIRGWPSLLEFLGFVFYYPSFLVGPSIEYRAYQHFIRGTGDYRAVVEDNLLLAQGGSGVDPSKPGGGGRRVSTWPSRLVATARAVGIALAMFALNQSLSPSFNYERVAEDPTYAEYTGWPAWRRFLYCQVTGIVERAQFYVAWKLSEGACILAGMGFNGVDPVTGAPRWDRCANVDIFNIEFAENIRMYLSTLSMVTTCGRIARRQLRPLAHSIAGGRLLPIYHAAGWLATGAAVNYASPSFQLRRLDLAWRIWAADYFAGHIAMGVVLAADAIASSLPRQRPRSASSSSSRAAASSSSLTEGADAVVAALRSAAADPGAELVTATDSDAPKPRKRRSAAAMRHSG